MSALVKIIRFIPKYCRSVPIAAKGFHTCSVDAKRLPNPWILATGKELWEAIQHKKGNVDPFLTEPIIRGPGTRDCPNVILSPCSSRIVGCVCNKDVHHIVWFWVHENCPRRCNCNYWFVLERYELPELYEDKCCCP
ncbi:UNVERIFIED_CONTAM: hypothetical protein PYX00_008966 [Menopon gallinae]|uniref:Cytochrome c oxidase subunit Vb n=1 Tax=Menopon gallinae TaxID=328185 RepID=A0AAW2H9H4_9NEOP